MTDPEAEPRERGLTRWWRTFLAWPRPARIVAYVAAGMVLTVVVGLLAVLAVVRRPLPETGGDLAVPGLAAPVRVVRDDAGIPQLYGDSMADLMRAQGYVHAQERFFQMDVRRLATAGRLAEVFGEDALDSDKMVRTLGWRRIAAQELALLTPQTRTALQQYADGVNAYLDSRSPSRLAVEYAMLRAGGVEYRPEPWTPVDSLAWLKAMAWDLRGNIDAEIGRVLAGVDLDPDEVDRLYPQDSFGPPIVDGGAVVDGVFDPDATGGSRNPERVSPAWADRTDRTDRTERSKGDARDADASDANVAAALTAARRAADAVPDLLGTGDGIGSNSWVLSGEHTDTGAPILANDPHLGVDLPGVWMQVGLHCNEVSAACPLDVAGFSFAGVPGVVIGHNADIAWGFTNLGADVTDLFLERVRDEEWRYDRAWRPLRMRTETIRVHDGEDFELRVRETDHGPLISDVSAELSSVGANAPAGGGRDDIAVSLAWTALRPGTTADAILGINLASNWQEFRAAAAEFAVPAQNLVYADVQGHIGYQAPGTIPIRQSGNDGSTPVAGWKPENDWTDDVVPFEALPHVLDPDAGYVVTANQAVADSDYPYYLTDDFDRGYRARRIAELIESGIGDEIDGEKVTLEDSLRWQVDTENPMAATLVPYLLDVEAGLDTEYYRDGPDLLADWDGRDDADSAAAAYFNAVWRALLRLTFHDELRDSLRPDGGDRWFAVVTDLLADEGAEFWDDQATEDVTETRDDILLQAMRDARDDLTAHLSLRPQEWEWGKIHRLELRTATLGSSGIAPLEWIENRGPWLLGGGSSVVDATGWDASQGYAVTTAPSMRMVVSLADLDDSRWINLTGVSGHPGSSHYVDQTDLWARGETLPWAFSREAVADAEDSTATLSPVSE